MTSVVAAGRRVLPRGWADLARQLVIWFGFFFAYQIARGFADRNPAKAFWNGYRVIEFEQRWTHHLVELTAQNIIDSSRWLLTARRCRLKGRWSCSFGRSRGCLPTTLSTRG